MNHAARIADVCARIGRPDPNLDLAVQRRLDRLTKPPGSLGRLEQLAMMLARMQGTERPRAVRKLVVVMAADHGVCADRVSAYPSEVTAQMVLNFVAGGAAINVLARSAGARVLVVDMGVQTEIPGSGFLNRKIAPGTCNLAEGPAMTAEQAYAAVAAGVEIAEAQAAEGLDLIAGGDMGIGNTTASSAITALVTGATPQAVLGAGTGLDRAGLERKRTVLARALAVHAAWQSGRDGMDLLRRVGGFEIAGLTGLMLGASAARVPIVLDGFIATAAALAAAEICPAVRNFLIAAHRSAEPGHALALRHLDLEPLLEWQLRLGEGTGAALVFPLLEAACRMLAEMATFESAGVSDAAQPPASSGMPA